ncbi:MAG: SAM-dependent DNA methyltransferase [Euryarchaeota archaeon]|nr:SAM-dependent DNA methyltransferase [Euryarchaeota archaeon]MDE1835959.1 SAM-dependent DNA methyltransferase [Euryarchaeota archaeon]MDE1881102.1 SAM-dependent DNA methyltransferase [Euryarchaeota archaeon]MDE2044363.1 SAM-dependent DNA methyltransferase [Thermoplasmata archaeon]
MATNHSQQIGRRLWDYCHNLRDVGLSYGDYLEQLTFLLFLKMADEQTHAPWNRSSPVPAQFAWPSLLRRSGDDLETHYRHVLESLGKEKGMLGLIFRKAQNKIQDPALLERLVKDLIDHESWMSLDVDVKGAAYEELLERNAEDVRGGAGQYFTPRPLIRAIVEVVNPQPRETICDPACGTGGFLLAAHDYVVRNNPNLDRAQKKRLKLNTLQGVELVDGVTRLCAMNFLLHGIGPQADEAEPPVRTDDSLRAAPSDHFNVVLTNPPFGRKAAFTITNEEAGADRQALLIIREDFWAETSNKQLNFLQHVKSLLEMGGRAAIVVPDNVLFEGGAGETIRRKLLETCDVHTLLRLPTGIFYAKGVKANVLFFEKKPGSPKPWTTKLWVYDLRTNQHFTLRTNPLKREDLDEFVQLYNPVNRHARRATYDPKSNPQGRWRSYDLKELLARDKASLDLTWVKDESLEDSANLPEPHVLAAEIAEDLEDAAEQFAAIANDLAARVNLVPAQGTGKGAESQGEVRSEERGAGA